MIGRRFAHLTIMSNKDIDIDSMITTFNTAVTETASETLCIYRQKKKNLDHCRNSWSVRQKERTEKEKIWAWRIWEIKEVNNNITRCMKRAKENWIGEQCSESEENLRKDNSKRAYQLIKELTTVKQGKAASRYCPRSFRKMPHRRMTDTEPMDRILLWAVQLQGQWKSISTELSADTHRGGEVEAAVQSLKQGKSAGANNIPADLIQADGEDVITALTAICNKIWQTGEWPTSWTQSLVITLPKKGNLQQC